MSAVLAEGAQSPRLSSVHRTLAKLVGGSLAGQALVAASTPLITRLYAPDRIGEVAIFSAVLTAGAVIATLGFEKAVPLPTSDRDAARLVRMALTCSIPLSLIVTVISLRLLPTLAGLTVALLLAFGLIAVASFNTGLSWAIRSDRMALVGRTRALQGAGQAITQVVGGVLTSGSFIALGLGVVASRCVGGISLLRGARSRQDLTTSQAAEKTQRELARRYRGFALFSMPASLANSLSLLLPPMMIAIAYGTTRGGVFTISSRLAMLPAIILSGALTPAYLERISRRRRERNRPPPVDDATTPTERQVFVAFAGSLLALGAVAAVFVAASASMAGTLLGSRWSSVGPDLLRLLPVVALQPAASTISQTLNAVEQNRGQLVWEMSRLCLLAAVVIFSRRLGLSALAAVTGISAVLTGSYLAILIMSWRALAPIEVTR